LSKKATVKSKQLGTEIQQAHFKSENYCIIAQLRSHFKRIK